MVGAIAALGVMVGTALATTAVTAPAAAVTVTEPGPVVHVASGRCLDVNGARTAPGTAVLLYDCHGGANQQWEHTANGELRTYDGTRCLTQPVWSTRTPRLQIDRCTGTERQRWQLTDDGLLVSARSGRCAEGGRGLNTRPVTLATCAVGDRQVWQVQGSPVDGPGEPTDPDPGEPDPGEPGPAPCDTPLCEITEVANDTDVPWGLVQLPDDTVLYGQRDAFGIIAMNADGSDQRQVGTVPGAASTGLEGGVLGLEISPDFADDQWLYVYHSTATDNRVVRFRYDGQLRTDTAEVVIDEIPRARIHNGGRIRFGPDGMLYIATGDVDDPPVAQDLSSLAGKVLRVGPDGSVPEDNPFGDAIWSYGHRNPQGLAFDSEGRLWQQEFGAAAQDETNLIVRGGNYGWPACEGTVGDCDDPDFIAPALTYSPAAASCSGIAVVDDALYVACLRGARLYRAEIDGDTLTNVTQHLVGTYGRMRTVEPSNDGGLWITTSTDDRNPVPNTGDELILHVTLGQ
ncbi:hypothetical protein N869_01260 [Cellulomonas bogoriensis 69B4 = DSM 16987]|uniref:Ricin B lectin domain-containing protein n=1 Tax=Cellulomonas bogoriensis 69B4 = DSM 16987 TaxID=1386082 RepID=A0A0A0C4B6_9CELL|nr:hypothetical protein N869_01260 [Cellulomonas bogoriensis 69B4 = DSM 16987]